MSVSMEEFGPVAVDYFHGHIVEEVTEAERYPDDGVWWIRFHGGGMIANTDAMIPKPPAELVGLALTLTVLGVQETAFLIKPPPDKPGQHGPPPPPPPPPPQSVTLLYFGSTQDPRQYVVALNPTEYAISEENYTGGTWVFAQRSTANMPDTPPHPDERIADGPADGS